VRRSRGALKVARKKKGEKKTRFFSTGILTQAPAHPPTCRCSGGLLVLAWTAAALMRNTVKPSHQACMQASLPLPAYTTSQKKQPNKQTILVRRSSWCGQTFTNTLAHSTSEQPGHPIPPSLARSLAHSLTHSLAHSRPNTPGRVCAGALHARGAVRED